jgi:hypothetical protein
MLGFQPLTYRPAAVMVVESGGRMRKFGWLFLILGAGIAGFAAAAPYNPMGNETINYTYDARGRLTNVTHAGSVNNNLQANYTYDKADSRATVNVTGSPH